MKSNAHFDITGLYYFSVVAEERSFSRASNRLHIAQPAISRRIKTLEEDLGVQVFTRHARGVDLTDAGESLLASSYSLFRHIDNLRENALISADTPRGTIALGILPMPGEYIIPHLVEQAKQLYPEIKFRIVEGYSSDLYRMLINQEINIAIMHEPMPHPEIVADELLLDYLCLVAPPNSLSQPSYTFEEAAAHPLILPDSPNLLRIRLDQISDERNIPLNIILAGNGFWLTKSMIRAGLGSTIVTFGAVVTDLEKGLLDAAPICKPHAAWPLVVATRHDQQRKLALVVIKELIELVVVEMRSKDIWKQMPETTD